MSNLPVDALGKRALSAAGHGCFQNGLMVVHIRLSGVRNLLGEDLGNATLPPRCSLSMNSKLDRLGRFKPGVGRVMDHFEAVIHT